MNERKGNHMNTNNEKRYWTVEEAMENPDFEFPGPREPHPMPCANEECFWHGRLDMANAPSIAEERWRIVDEGDRWTLW